MASSVAMIDGMIDADDEANQVLDLASFQQQVRATTRVRDRRTIQMAPYDNVSRLLSQCTSKPILEPPALRLVYGCLTSHANASNAQDDVRSSNYEAEATQYRKDAYNLTRCKKLEDMPRVLEAFARDGRVKSKLIHPAESLQWPNGKKHLYNIGVAILDAIPTITTTDFVTNIKGVAYITEKCAKYLIEAIPEAAVRTPQAVGVPAAAPPPPQQPRGDTNRNLKLFSGNFAGANFAGANITINQKGDTAASAQVAPSAETAQHADVKQHADSDNLKHPAVANHYDEIAKYDETGQLDLTDTESSSIAVAEEENSNMAQVALKVSQEAVANAVKSVMKIIIKKSDKASSSPSETESSSSSSAELANVDACPESTDARSDVDSRLGTLPPLGWRALVPKDVLSNCTDSNGTFICFPPSIDLRTRLGFVSMKFNLVDVVQVDSVLGGSPTIQLKSVVHQTVVTHNMHYSRTPRQCKHLDSERVIVRGVYLYQEIEHLRGPLAESDELERENMKAELQSILCNLSGRCRFNTDDGDAPICNPDMELPSGLDLVTTYDQDFASLGSFKNAFKSPEYFLSYVHLLFQKYPNISRGQYLYNLSTKFPGTINQDAFEDLIEDIEQDTEENEPHDGHDPDFQQGHL